MNMRLEEYQLIQVQKQQNQKKGRGAKERDLLLLSKSGFGSSGPHRSGLPSQRELTISSCESFVSLDEPPKDYEMILQKYEAEVRNHIKIEQQLKLHIECL